MSPARLSLFCKLFYRMYRKLVDTYLRWLLDLVVKGVFILDLKRADFVRVNFQLHIVY